MSNRCFATLITSNDYLPGALTLAHSLRSAGTMHDIVALVPPNVLSSGTISALYRVYDRLLYVSMLKSGAAPDDARNLELLGRKELDITFTKFHVFNPEVMGGYERVAFLDADAFAVRNVDDIFAYLDGGATFAAAPDAGWPDIFNSGVFVTTPQADIFEALLKEASEKGSFDGGDQGILNSFFGTWSGFSTGSDESPSRPATRLPFTYNLTPSAVYTYLPAYTRFRSDIAIVHFAGTIKPWRLNRFSDGTVIQRDMQDDNANLHNQWWRLYDSIIERFLAEDQAAQTVHLPPREGEGESSSESYFSSFAPSNDSFVPWTPPPTPGNSYSPSQSYQTPLPSGPLTLRYDWDQREFPKARAPRAPSPVKTGGLRQNYTSYPQSAPVITSGSPIVYGASVVATTKSAVASTLPQTPTSAQSASSQYRYQASGSASAASGAASASSASASSAASASALASGAAAHSSSHSSQSTVVTHSSSGSTSVKSSRVITTTVTTTRTTVITSSNKTIRVPSPTRKYLEEGELSPDGELSFTTPKSAWSEVATPETGYRTTVTAQPTEVYQYEENGNGHAHTPGEYTRSRYEWDVSEFTQRQRRLSETKLGSITTKITTMEEGSALTPKAYTNDEEEELYDEEEVDEDGIRMKPALKTPEPQMSRISSSSSIASMGGDARKRLSGSYSLPGNIPK
ncbi:hypothetical protein HDU97_001184 [Phlyctochytrium planicorne]|nr:hypothetical protein HDU97_001184 [Phlyctochytrium planicorne]